MSREPGSRRRTVGTLLPFLVVLLVGQFVPEGTIPAWSAKAVVATAVLVVLAAITFEVGRGYERA
ncbi:hypothetical protein [Halolamina salina]|uniref:Uncharacterized protein n=1 Tax=Halolamina salina TaxID=1220023 RepID=A0ABD6B6Y3_9EURY